MDRAPRSSRGFRCEHQGGNVNDTMELIEAIECGISDLDMMIYAFAEQIVVLGDIAQRFRDAGTKGTT